MTEPRGRETRVAAYAVCIEERGMLLVRIAPGATAEHDGMWTLPGGGIAFGEHPRDTAIRELAEETGLVGEVEELAGVDSWTGHVVHPRDGVPTDFHAIRVLYRVRVVGGTLRDEVDGTTDTCAWVPITRLRELPAVDLVHIGARMAGAIP